MTYGISNTWTSPWDATSIAGLVEAVKSALKEALANSDPYAIQLVLLVFLVLSVVYTQRRVFYGTNSDLQSLDPEQMHGKVQDGFSSAASSLGKRYLLVYGLVMGKLKLASYITLCLTHALGADWLQGPYLYSLYREQYNFSERLVAILFVTGFVSAGVAAPFVGTWADE